MASPDEITKAIELLSKKRLLVGIPQRKDPRPGEPIGNVSLGYIHEFGSPARNIPARPFLVPGVQGAIDSGAITKQFEEAVLAALRGSAIGVDKAFHAAGAEAVTAVQLFIQAGIPPPLSPVTVARRRQRSPGSSYRRKAVGQGDVTPLWDTGALLGSITYDVEG